MSSVLDHVASRFGIATKAGIGMGIAFSGINIAVGALQQAIGGMIDYVKDGVEANRAFELSMARLSVSTNTFSVTMGSLKDTLKNFSVMFATDLNALSDGLRGFIREGYSSADSLKLLFESERLAVVSGEDLASVQNSLVTAMEVFNLSAGDASNIIKQFNDITSTTGLTVSDIDNVLSRAADSIRTSGISFSDIVNILYTLEGQGYSSRSMLIKLKDVIDNWPSDFKVDILPAGSVPDIDTKFKKIQGTVAFTTEMMKQLGTISQMDLTGGLDFDAMFGKEKIDRARKYFDTLNNQGIKTLTEFNSVSGQLAAKELNPDFKYIGIDKQLWQLMRTMYQYNDMVVQTAKSSGTWQDRLQGIRDTIDSLNTKLVTQNATLAQASQAIGDLTEMRQYTIDMHNATAAVQDHQDAIKALQRISDQYALSQTKNSLAILKIQYNADERHGLDRTQKEAIANLEKSNASLRIKEMEQQISISEIQQNGLQAAQDALDQIRRQHDEVMYDQQIRDLDANIKAKNEIYASTLTAIAETNTQIAAQQKKWQENQLVMTVHWAQEMRDQMNYAYGKDTTVTPKTPAQQSGTQEAVPNPPGWNSRIPFWKYQQGGFVKETAPALVHKGEFIIPKELVSSFMKKPKEMPHINIADIMPREKPDVKSPGVEPRKTDTLRFDMPDFKPMEIPDIKIPEIKPRELPRMTLSDLREPGSPIVSQPARVEHHHYANVNVNVAELRKDVDVEEWGRKLGAGLSSGFLSGSSSASSSVTSRKGGTVVVPGTTTTIARTGRVPGNSAVIQQPIKHKGRFRVG
jgi:hypothetical protein